MKLKDLFTVPENEKITDKTFAKVLVASVCGILLCMGCLVGATWAWFVANTENADNIIEIASVTTDIAVYRDSAEIPAEEDGSYLLPVGSYALQMRIENNATDANRPVYLLLTVTQGDAETCYYLPFINGETEAAATLHVENATAVVRFSAHWALPMAQLLTDEVTVSGETTTMPSAPTTESTAPTTESTDPTTESTVPTTEQTESTTESTAPTTEQTDPTTESTDPTTEQTTPTEE